MRNEALVIRSSEKIRTYAFQSCIPVMKTVLATRASKIPTNPDKNIERISCHIGDTNSSNLSSFCKLFNYKQRKP